MAPDELATLLLEDLPFYASSGGITFSGGEAGLYSAYCAETAERLKKHDVHVALQTAGMFPWDPFSKRLLPCLDMIYFDLKLLDPLQHLRYTGSRNELILANFRKLAEATDRVTATMLLVPGVNDDPASVTALKEFVCGCGVKRFLARTYFDGAEKRWRPVAMARRAMVGTATHSKGIFGHE